ncbi:hypothetical protein [Actinoplanes derwentensis]|uniref:hypothetical protein n=1 Tax=Actinoplanes derwentensis TaxID=113562 RepID=UPI0012FE5011|nr:hypothetical protein [Actinoplanes derwentensis]GID90577.1 hypothetical protein Ade03nite_95010 [Actinoplanes derwentensis]
MMVDIYDPDPSGIHLIVERWYPDEATWIQLAFSQFTNTKFAYSTTAVLEDPELPADEQTNPRSVPILQPGLATVSFSRLHSQLYRPLKVGDEVRCRYDNRTLFDGIVSQTSVSGRLDRPGVFVWDFTATLISDSVLALTEEYCWVGSLPEERAIERLKRVETLGWTVAVQQPTTVSSNRKLQTQTLIREPVVFETSNGVIEFVGSGYLNEID